MAFLKSRAGMLILATLSVLIASNLLSSTVTTDDFSENYPASVCPPAPSGVSASVSTPSVHSPYHLVRGRSLRDKEIKTLRYASGSTPIVIDAQSTTPLMWQSRVGAWAGGVACQAPQSSQWFVGGTADITSKGLLIVVNSGLSSALVDVYVWSESGAQPRKTLTVGANAAVTVRLDSLAPGSSRLAIHVIPRSGRINAFMVDERGKGLRALGGDLVNSMSSPQKTLYIVGIPESTQPQSRSRARTQSAAASHVLRIAVPGAVNARFNVDVISSTGIFAPVGFSGRTVAAGQVSEFPFNPNVGNGNYAIKITSDQPIVASIFSTIRGANGRSDFVWSTPTLPLQEFSMATSGLNPVLVFTGDSISLSIRALFSNGKVKNFAIKGSDLLTWRTPANTRSLTLTKVGKKIYGGALQSSANGIGFYPLQPGSVLTRTAIPRSNIRVLNP